MDELKASKPEGGDKKLEKVHEQALKRFKRALEADNHNREHALECAEFAVGNQWPEEIKKQREAQGRPCITINRAPSILRQVTNEVRISPPAISVLPAEEGDIETANIHEGLIRSIENTSKAKRIYAKAMEDAARCTMGFWRVKTDYKDAESFDQDILIEHIENPLSVIFDPDSRDPMGSDWEFAFVLEGMTKDRFHEIYGDHASYGIDGDDTTNPEGFYSEHWIEGEIVQVAEYFMVEREPRTLVMLEGGSIVDAEEYDEAAQSYNDALAYAYEAQVAYEQAAAEAQEQGVEPPPPPEEVQLPEPPPVPVFDDAGEPRTRETARKKIVSYIMSGGEILSGPHYHASTRIPIVPVWGEEYRIGDRKVRQCVISNMMEPARLQNYWRSASVEKLALSPKAPWLLTAKQIEGHEDAWREVGQGNPAWLTYNPDDKVAGGKPTRVEPAPIESAMLQESAIAADDIKATTGIYDASLGARSNETSGRAIQARQAEGDVSTYVYLDNLLHAVEETGRIIISMIPRVYDTDRTVRILGKKEEAEIIRVNDGGQYDLRVGKYDVSISTAASYTSRRQENAAILQEVLRTNPQLAPVLIPRLLDLMDLPDGDEILEEVKRLTQPQGPPPVDPKDQAQAAKLIAEAESKEMDTHIKALELESYDLPLPGEPLDDEPQQVF